MFFQYPARIFGICWKDIENKTVHVGKPLSTFREKGQLIFRILSVEDCQDERSRGRKSTVFPADWSYCVVCLVGGEKPGIYPFPPCAEWFVMLCSPSLSAAHRGTIHLARKPSQSG